MIASVLDLDNNGMAVIQGEGNAAVTQGAGVIAKYLGAPAMQGSNTVIVAGGKPLDVVGVGNQSRCHVLGLGPQSQQRFQKVDGRS